MKPPFFIWEKTHKICGHKNLCAFRGATKDALTVKSNITLSEKVFLLLNLGEQNFTFKGKQSGLQSCVYIFLMQGSSHVNFFDIRSGFSGIWSCHGINGFRCILNF